jgi:hypothetical protein
MAVTAARVEVPTPPTRVRASSVTSSGRRSTISSWNVEPSTAFRSCRRGSVVTDRCRESSDDGSSSTRAWQRHQAARGGCCGRHRTTPNAGGGARSSAAAAEALAPAPPTASLSSDLAARRASECPHGRPGIAACNTCGAVCRHDEFTRRCDKCWPIVARLPLEAWANRAGSAFHRSKTCPALTRGQRIAQGYGNATGLAYRLSGSGPTPCCSARSEPVVPTTEASGRAGPTRGAGSNSPGDAARPETAGR